MYRFIQKYSLSMITCDPLQTLPSACIFLFSHILLWILLGFNLFGSGVSPSGLWKHSDRCICRILCLCPQLAVRESCRQAEQTEHLTHLCTPKTFTHVRNNPKLYCGGMMKQQRWCHTDRKVKNWSGWSGDVTVSCYHQPCLGFPRKDAQSHGELMNTL